MYSHRDAHGVVVSMELDSCTCVCADQTKNMQVGAQQDLAVTCGSRETCAFFFGVESVRGIKSANPLGSSGLNEELPKRPNAPMEGIDLHASVQAQKGNTCSVVLRTNCETCVGETGVWHRLLLRATIVSI